MSTSDSVFPTRYVERVFPTTVHVIQWEAPVPQLTEAEHDLAMGVHYYFHALYAEELGGLLPDPDAENLSWVTPVEVGAGIGLALALLLLL